MSYILYSATLNLPLARVDADPAAAQLPSDQIALPCAPDANVDDVAHWQEVAASLPEPTPEELLAKARAVKLAEINAATDAVLRTLTATYPASELLTFDKQETEARAYLADSTAPTPLLTALAVGRGITLADLAGRVIAKADAFAAASGYVIGQRQALEDQLDAAQTVEAVQAIVVNLALPGAAATPSATPEEAAA